MNRNMIISFRSIIMLIIIFIANISLSIAAEREILNFNVGWKYYLGNPHVNPWQYDYNDENKLISKIISNQSIPGTSDHVFTGLSANITNPWLWNIDDPYLHT